MGFKVGDRVYVDRDICTVRFIGEIRRWPGSLTYGVEWDDAERGKNSGMVDGEEYFKVLVANAGSFIKESKWSKSASTGIPLCQALQNKYGKCNYKSDDIYLGNKKVESFGFDKLEIHRKEFKGVRKICLDHCRIETLASGSAEVAESFSNVSELDLSYNLFTDFKETCCFLSSLTSLTSLDLSGNYFTKGWENSEVFVFPRIKYLYLSSCHLEFYQLRQILRQFPSIEILNVSRNNLSEIDHITFTLPEKLKELVLSDNAIKFIPPGLSQWGIELLNLSHNLIQTVSPISSNILASLDLSFNSIENWSEMDQLNNNFPKLNSFRINGNPVFENREDHLAQFYQVAARFNKLTILNGSFLSDGERKEAIFYFVSQVFKGSIDYDKSSDLWLRLCREVDVKSKPKIETKSWLDSQILRIRVVCEHTQKTINLTILSGYSVRNLKRIVCKKFGLDLFEVKMSYMMAPCVLEIISQEFCPVSDLHLENEGTIYVKQTIPKH